MAERNPPAWLQGGSHPADLDRLLIQTLLPTGGVIDKDGGHLLVTEQATAAMGVTVAAGRAVIPGTQSADQGHYHAYNDAPVDKNVAASDATNPRIDLVVARVGDVFYDAGASGEWEVQVVTGVAEATPSEPAVPDNAIVLARIDVGAGVSSITDADITDRRVHAAPRSGLAGILTIDADDTFDHGDFPWLRAIRIRGVAAGGGGGSSGTGGGTGGAGGGAGEGGEMFLTVDQLASSEAITVGIGGNGGASSSDDDGDPGTDSSFGSHMVLAAGAGGQHGASSQPEGGDGGSTGTGGDFRMSGKGGGLGWGGSARSGEGGDSMLGAGGKAEIGSAGGRSADGPGGGGGGGSRVASGGVGGGRGGDGRWIIELYA